MKDRIAAVCLLGLFLVCPLVAADRCSCDSAVHDKIDQYDAKLNLTGSDKFALTKKHFAWGQPLPPAGASGEHLLYVKDYLIWHDDDLRDPLWVAYKLTRGNLSHHRTRLQCFRKDPRLPETAAGTCDDYDEPVFDRGHMAPNADMERSESAMLNTYFFSNMTPQYSNFNRGIWQHLEIRVRDWVEARGTLCIISGAVFDRNGDGIRDADVDARRVAPLDRVAIPTQFYKIVLQKHGFGQPEAIAILLPHDNLKHADADAYLSQHITTIRKIESLTGIDFFPKLSSAKQEMLETTPTTSLWSH